MGIGLAGAFLILAAAARFLPWWIDETLPRAAAGEWLTPLDTGRRSDWDSLLISRKGHFLGERTAYGHLDVHVHTGVDLQNGSRRGGPGEPVYAAANGKVYDVKLQEQGTRVTIRHLLPTGEIVFSSYIHVGGVRVKKGMSVGPGTQVARRFDRAELRQYGPIYNHLHFQIHKDRFVPEHTIETRTVEEANARFYDPAVFFRNPRVAQNPEWRRWVREGKISFWKLLAILL